MVCIIGITRHTRHEFSILNKIPGDSVHYSLRSTAVAHLPHLTEKEMEAPGDELLFKLKVQRLVEFCRKLMEFNEIWKRKKKGPLNGSEVPAV